MRFGLWAPARVDIASLAEKAEARGFHYLHLYDSQSLYAETFACLALCAARTSSIKLGHGVTNPSTRIAPLMASGLATINQLAPGRTFLAIGTGYSTMQAMGFPPARLADLKIYIEQVRALVRGDVTEFAFRDRTRTIGIIDPPGGPDDRFVNLSDPIPVYVAATGPKALALAGELADAVVLNIRTPDDVNIDELREKMAVGAERVGRDAEQIPIIMQLNVYVMEPGERFGSRWMRESVLGLMQSMIGNWAARRAPVPGKLQRVDAADIPEEFSELAAAYRSAVDYGAGGQPLDGDAWYLQAYQGHAWRLHPDLLDRVPEELMRKRAFIAEPDEIVSQFKQWEKLGVVAVGPQVQFDLEHGAVVVDRFAEYILPHFAEQAMA
jgi:alkanesulfonate monooxygenase SsuD/methylene tetrahydromethanopterin reductase-like flavin-dependent oxidoreductase (luciferase family)